MTSLYLDYGLNTPSKQLYRGTNATLGLPFPFPLTVGNRTSIAAIELASVFSRTGFKGGVPSHTLFIGLALSILAVLSGDETLDLTSGDIVGVM